MGIFSKDPFLLSIKISLIFIAIFFSMVPAARAQHSSQYLIYFTDKKFSEYSIDQPGLFLSPKALHRRKLQHIPISESDLPPNKAYIKSIAQQGAKIIFTSRWLNAVLVDADPEAIGNIKQFSFIKDVTPNTFRNLNTCALSSMRSLERIQNVSANDYGQSFNQCSMIGIDQMHADNFAGKGKLIAVLDAGFLNAPNIPAFDSLFLNNRVKATYDFVQNNKEVFEDDAHGTEVLSCLAAYQPGNIIGGAYQADFLLLRTEDNTLESISEEVFWLKGAEYADSAGADIISSSLGYSTFDQVNDNHYYEELNGRTTIISKAAAHAAAKGILVVNSGGNDGSKPWKYIFAPADADSILAIGSVDVNRQYSNFSSIGPASDGRIKPDLAAMGSQVTVVGSDGSLKLINGTSFAAPLVAGLAAGVWQSNPNMTAQQIRDLLLRSASQYNQPDNVLGYGIPSYSKAKSLLPVNKSEIDFSSLKLNLDNFELISTGTAFSTQGNIRVMDLYGKLFLVIPTNFSGNALSLPQLESLPKGVYFITFTNQQQVYVVKIGL